MGWLEDLFGVENAETTKMMEKDIALDMLKDSKFVLNATAIALTETTNPQLREILKRQLNEIAQNHFRLADLSVHNNWYMPHSAPIEQIKNDYEEAST